MSTASMRVVFHLLWLLMTLTVAQLHIIFTGQATPTTLGIIAIMVGLQSIYGFLRQGGRVVNASAIAIYGILLFCVFPSFYVAIGQLQYAHRTDIESLIIAASLTGIMQWIILALCPPTRIQPRGLHNTTLSSNASRFGVTFLVVAVPFNMSPLGLLANATGMLAIFFTALALATATTAPQIMKTLLIFLMSMTYYIVFIFDGFGRLTLGAIAIGILSILTLRGRSYLPKIGVLLITAPGILILSYQRVAFLEETRGTDISFDEGLGSVVGPFISAGVIITRMLESTVDPAWGMSVFAAFVVWVPSAIWAGKPAGFGSEIVPVTRPELAHVEVYSDAALLLGEGVWNFGVGGSFVMFIMVALWLRWLDIGFRQAARPTGEHPVNTTTCRIILITLLSSGILNLIWGGWHTYTARSFVALALVVAVLGFVALVRTFDEHRYTASLRSQSLKPTTVIPVDREFSRSAPVVDSGIDFTGKIALPEASREAS